GNARWQNLGGEYRRAGEHVFLHHPNVNQTITCSSRVFKTGVLSCKVIAAVFFIWRKMILFWTCLVMMLIVFGIDAHQKLQKSNEKFNPS
ncbi:MAG: hypothetical protein ABSF99_12700, partial [Anaerolineales bacterium]